MKTLKKFIAPVLLTLFLTLSSSFVKKAGPVTLAGTYATYQDYTAKKLTEWDEIKFGHGKFKGTLKGKKIASSYKDASYWGGQNDEGVVYRFNKVKNIAVQVITNAKICFYAGMELSVERYDNGSVKEVNINDVEKSTKFSEIFWLSEGGEGEMIPASLDNLCKLMADNTDLVAKMKAKGLEEKNKDNVWFDNLNTISGWIKEYMKTAK